MKVSRRALLERLGTGAALAAAGPRLAAARLSRGAGAGREPRAAGPIRLHRNENARGPSPKVVAAVAEAARRVAADYPDEEAAGLRRAIARLHAVPAEEVVLGCGSS